MKKLLLSGLLLGVAFFTTSPANADNINDPHIQVGPCAAGFPNCGGDPNLLGTRSSVQLFDQGSSSGNGSGQPLGSIALILVVPSTISFTTPTISTVSSGTGQLGGTNFLGGHWNTTTGLVSTTPLTSGDLINYVGFMDNGDGSDNTTNFNGEEALIGFPTGSYNAFVYSLTNTGLSGPNANPLTINFTSNLPKGTIVLAYSCLAVDISGNTCTGGGTGFVPWTTAGFVNGNSNVPEPASMALFGTGLFGLAGIVRRRALKK